MKKFAILAFTLLVPCFLFLEIWGVFRYDKLKDEITALEKEQDNWLEANKKAITGIAFASSPERIAKIVKNDPGIDLLDESEVIKIEFVDRGKGN
jgi:hypothetical protein